MVVPIKRTGPIAGQFPSEQFLISVNVIRNSCLCRIATWERLATLEADLRDVSQAGATHNMSSVVAVEARRLAAAFATQVTARLGPGEAGLARARREQATALQEMARDTGFGARRASVPLTNS
jgi:hypothetical protein